MTDVDWHIPSLEAVSDFEMNLLCDLCGAFLPFEECVNLRLESFSVGDHFFSAFDYDGEIVATELLELCVFHPKCFDKAEIVPRHVRMLGAMVFVEGEDLLGGLGGNVLETFTGGEGKPDL